MLFYKYISTIFHLLQPTAFKMPSDSKKKRDAKKKGGVTNGTGASNGTTNGNSNGKLELSAEGIYTAKIKLEYSIIAPFMFQSRCVKSWRKKPE